MPFSIVRQDITKMDVDAVVNAANTALAMGGGVCGAIFKAAGKTDMQRACDKLSPIKTGEAVITPGFALKARYVVHAAGPVYDAQNPAQSRALLYGAYESSLRVARKNGCRSIAFPLISSGVYGYPKKAALDAATSAIREFLDKNDMDVYLVVFDRAAFTLSEKLMGAVESYIDENYVDERLSVPRRPQYEKQTLVSQAATLTRYEADAALAPPMAAEARIEDVLKELDEPFSVTLLRLIDVKGRTDVDVYKRANLDRKLFSKIRRGKGYMPGKRTVVALAISLELTLPETSDLLLRAGYALSHSQKFDVIVEYFIVNGIYDIYEINEVLFKYDLPLLGA